MEIIDDKNLNYFLRMYYIIYGESSTIPRKKIKKVKGCGKWDGICTMRECIRDKRVNGR